MNPSSRLICAAPARAAGSRRRWPARRDAARWMRPVALVACLAQLGACASRPYVFTPALDAIAKEAAQRHEQPLAGDLHDALYALEEQRRAWWDAAGQTEAMKATTAVGLIGLGAVGLYKAMQGDLAASWLRRAGAVFGAGYATANWFEPDKTQRVYLAGAMSLTCLALQTAPYRMTIEDYTHIRDQVGQARGGVERLVSALRLRRGARSSPARDPLVDQGWRKVRFANRVLDSADHALGSIERIGPRLRDMTALASSEVARQMEKVVHDLTDVPAAIVALKAQSTLSIEPPPPAPEAQSESGDDNDGGNAASKGGESGPGSSTPAGTSAAAPCGKGQAQGFGLAPEAKSPPTRLRFHPTSTPADDTAEIAAALHSIDGPLGIVHGFVRRFTAARLSGRLPDACGGSAAAVRLVPARDAIVLTAGSSFRFLLEGDDGRPSAQWIGPQPPAGALELSLPLGANPGGAPVVRIHAQDGIRQMLQTHVRITDSRGAQQFAVQVTVCPAR